MNEQEIIEGNKLIAEFMGCVPARYFADLYIMTYMDNSPHINTADMKYYSDWSWLMPVVDKIISLPDRNKTNESKSILIRLKHFICSVQLEKGWYEVVFFIKWYNENKK